jgi:pimeloyl-ACP methyl ester carboxylesterase
VTAAAVDERLVDSGGVRLSVRRHHGDAVPHLLALHGLASNARWWDLVAPRLHPARRVVAVDLRGHGRSDRPESGYSFDEVTGDLVRLLDALSIDRVAVAGHSWGAAVALELAAREPQRAAGVVCIEGGLGDLRRAFGDSWEAAERAMTPPDLVGISEQQVRGWIQGSPLAGGSDDATAATILLGNFEPAPGGGLQPRLRRDRHMEIARHLYEWDGAAALARMTVPVSLVVAENDDSNRRARLAEAGERALAALGGRGRLEWIRGGHDLPVERPSEVAAAIDRLVASL